MVQEQCNLFILLDLDPNEGWSQECFEQRLKEKQREWSKLVPHPKHGMAAKGKLEKINKLKEIAENEAERDRHATEALRLKSAEREARRNALCEELELLQAKGYLLGAEVKDLVTRYMDVFSGANIRAGFHVDLIDVVEPPESPKDLFYPSKAREIDRYLDEFGKVIGWPIENLYAFLDCRPDNELV